MDKRVINYFDLGSHSGTEIILFLWHVNFLRKNGYLKDCVVNIHGFEPSPIIEFLNRRINALQSYTLKHLKDIQTVLRKVPFADYEAKHLQAFTELFNKENTNLVKTDVKNINIYEKALTNFEGEFKLFLSKRLEEYSDPNHKFKEKGNVTFEPEDLQPMDYIGSTLFESKVTGGINANNYKSVDGIIFSKWIKENIDNFEESINIVKMNIEGSESMVVGDLVDSDMLKHFQIICGYDLLADVRKIPELENTNKEFEKMLKDNDVLSRFIHFCADNEKNVLKDFGKMSEKIESELIERGWA